MAGDWVYIFDPDNKDDKGAYQVSEVREEGIRTKMFTDIYEENWFEPIPLTNEILRLNDFEYNHKAYANYKDTNIGVWCDWNYFNTDDERYSMYNHVGIWFVLGSEEMKVSYVHELQHALRLCGLNDMADNFKIE